MAGLTWQVLLMHWRGYKMVLICIGIIAAVFAADYWIKNRIEADGNLPRKICKGRIRLQRFHNRGAALNLGEKKQKLVATVSVILTLFVLALLIISFGKRGNTLLKLSLSLLLGGAFSNTYDRLKRRYVVDYLSFQVRWKRLAGIVFNLSDFCIMAGALAACLAGIK